MTSSRGSLSRDRILTTAVQRLDAAGLEALTMRAVASELGVEAMSLYHHVPDKGALLDGALDAVVDEVLAEVSALGLPKPAVHWQQDLRRTILTARQVMLRHPWAPALASARASLSPPVIAHHENLLRIMREGGFSWDLAHHALHALGSRALGFAQELFQPPSAAEQSEAGVAPNAAAPDLPVDRYPYLAGMLASISHDPGDPVLGWCDDQSEFEFALDLLLDGLEARRAAIEASRG